MAEPRSLRLTLVIGVLVVVSAVIAGVVIFSTGEATPDETDRTPPLAVKGTSLTMGRPGPGRTTVVVHEDFACGECRAFDLASRDFLAIEAQRGDVVVSYQPFVGTADAWSRTAFDAWASVASSGTPTQARTVLEVLVDRAPQPGDPVPGAEAVATWVREAGVPAAKVQGTADDPAVSAAQASAARAGATTLPSVVVDGTPLRAPDGTALADALQRIVVQKSGRARG